MILICGLLSPPFYTYHTPLLMFWIVLKWVDTKSKRNQLWLIRFLFLYHSYKIVDDVLNLARFSYSNYQTAILIVDYLQNEIDYIPWKAAFNNFDYILARFKPDEELLFKVKPSKRKPNEIHFINKSIFLFRNSKQNFWIKFTSPWASIRNRMINIWTFIIEIMLWQKHAELVSNSVWPMLALNLIIY